MRTTQKDIAAALNLSLITVQRAFNNSGYVSKEVKERIFAFAREVNYVPHKASQVLKRHRIRRIVLISTTEPSYFWADIRTGIELAAGEIEPFDYSVEYVQVPEPDAEGFLRALRSVVEAGVDALGFVHKWPSALGAATELLEQRSVPYVTFNVDARGSSRLCHIGPDYRSGGRLAAEYLGKALFFQPKASILVIGTIEDEAPARDAVSLGRLRWEGFQAVLAQHFPNVTADILCLPSNLSDAEAERELASIADSMGELPRAVYMTAPYNPAFIRAFERLDFDRFHSVLHDLDKTSFHCLEDHRLMAVVCQNPILQGYDTVKVLERVLDSNAPPSDIEVVHSLVFNANKEHYSNGRLAAAVNELAPAGSAGRRF